MPVTISVCVWYQESTLAFFPPTSPPPKLLSKQVIAKCKHNSFSRGGHEVAWHVLLQNYSEIFIYV